MLIYELYLKFNIAFFIFTNSSHNFDAFFFDVYGKIEKQIFSEELNWILSLHYLSIFIQI